MKKQQNKPYKTTLYKDGCTNQVEYDTLDIYGSDSVPAAEVIGYAEYNLWLEKHLHCDQASWNCPDESDCPHNKCTPICWVGVSDE